MERHWGDVNMVTYTFKLLEAIGALHKSDPGDIFSLIAVYRSSFVTMRDRKKKVDMANPDYPTGKQRRSELYTMYPSLLTPLSAEELQRARAVGDDYWAHTQEENMTTFHQYNGDLPPANY